MLENSIVVVVPVIALLILSLEPWVRLFFDHDFQDRPEKLIHIENKTPPPKIIQYSMHNGYEILFLVWFFNILTEPKWQLEVNGKYLPLFPLAIDMDTFYPRDIVSLNKA